MTEDVEIRGDQMQAPTTEGANLAAIRHYLAANRLTGWTIVGLPRTQKGDEWDRRLLGLIADDSDYRVLMISDEPVIAVPGVVSAHHISWRPYRSEDYLLFLDEDATRALTVEMPYVGSMTNLGAIRSYLTAAGRDGVQYQGATQFLDPYSSPDDDADVVGSFVIDELVLIIVIQARRGAHSVVTARLAGDLDRARRSHLPGNLPVA